MLNKEKQKLLSRINDLENENDFFKKKNEELVTRVQKKELEEIGEDDGDQPKYNKSDFLKCMYA